MRASEQTAVWLAVMNAADATRIARLARLYAHDPKEAGRWWGYAVASALAAIDAGADPHHLRELMS